MRMPIVLFGALFVAGCQSTGQTLVRTEYRLAEIPETVIRTCPATPAFPAYAALTDLQVADLVKRLYRNNEACYNAMQQVRSIQANAKKTLEQK